MARSTWKGHVSFGLVQIPVELYSAARDQDLSFDLLDRRDMNHVGYKKINKKTGEDVQSDDIVKGYEYDHGQYVIVDDEDFEKANIEATRTVDIVAFVDGDAIDPRYMVKPYYVIPTQKNPKAYALLREVLKRTGKVGIAKVVLRSRQYIAALVVQGDILVLELLRCADEIINPATLDAPSRDLEKLGVSPKEVEMAEMLVAGLDAEWDPEAYRDEYRDDLLALIQAKAKAGGVTPVAAPAARADDEGHVVDIMELLKRSLEASPKAKKAAESWGKTAAGKAKKAPSHGAVAQGG